MEYTRLKKYIKEAVGAWSIFMWLSVQSSVELLNTIEAE
jgi:hypothetical protein